MTAQRPPGRTAMLAPFRRGGAARNGAGGRDATCAARSDVHCNAGGLSRSRRRDSGSRSVSLSPGFTYAITPAVQVYAFVQLPLYQYFNGVQLVADRSYAVGVSAQF
jgi:hypothetical protein